MTAETAVSTAIFAVAAAGTLFGRVRRRAAVEAAAGHAMARDRT